MRRIGMLKPCPFCGGRGIMIVESKVLARCIWVECSDCKTSSPMLEFGSVWVECSDCKTSSPMLEFGSADGDAGALDEALRQARAQAAKAWNTRAYVGAAEGVAGTAG